MTARADSPLAVRVRFAHAAAQYLAEQLEIDLLHVKGPSLSPSLVEARGEGTDADLLTRPKDARRLIRALRNYGWREVTDFRTGSAFEHAATLHHDLFGYADIHRRFPGLLAPDAFDRLWERRVIREIAGVPCACLDPAAERLVLLVHAARSGGSESDLYLVWHNQPDQARDAVRALAAELGADVALAAALGELERHRGTRSYALWRAYSTTDRSRLDEWLARIRSAPNLAARAGVLARSLVPNVQHEEMRRGRRLTRSEKAGLWIHRYSRLVHEIGSRVRRERPRDSK